MKVCIVLYVERARSSSSQANAANSALFYTHFTPKYFLATSGLSCLSNFGTPLFYTNIFFLAKRSIPEPEKYKSADGERRFAKFLTGQVAYINTVRL